MKVYYSPTHAYREDCITTLTELEEERLRIRRSFVDSGNIYITTVNRLNIFSDLLAVYKTPNITSLELRVKFEGEAGHDGGGLTRELFPVFWKAVEDEICEGSSLKVPIMAPEINFTFYCLGKILSHGYILTGYLPLNLSGIFLSCPLIL